MTVQTIQSIHPPDRADATQARRHDDNPGPRVGITFSTFDLLHAGHIMMLAEAKRQCDYLIVGLQMDPTLDRPEKNAPTQTVVERYIQVAWLPVRRRDRALLDGAGRGGHPPLVHARRAHRRRRVPGERVHGA
ncbi:adenylyltransferase/cytidyltransferase family protein [Microbacterium aurugineum]|uniref:adenylyltransferase/cytidyltransferase family protein n=1 Tax=Microbacterium aurugineum TaxID=2851642 RepID=UPI0039BDB621